MSLAPEVGSAQPRSALAEPGFRRYMLGSLIARTGDWVDLVALNWAVLSLTHSAWQLALINVCRLAPVFVLSVPAGVLADRHERRGLLLALHGGLVAASALLAFAMGAGAPFAVIAAIVTLRACLSSCEPVVRNAYLPRLVSREQLPTALAHNSTMLTIARLAGPAIAGWALAFLPVAHLFWASALGGLVVLASLVGTPKDAPEHASSPTGRRASPRADVAEAFAYVRRTPAVAGLMALAIVPMVCAFPYTAMLPLFARELLQLSGSGFAALLSASALGALGAGLWLSWRPGTEADAEPQLLWALAGFGASWLAFLATPTLWAAAAAMAAVGYFGQRYRTLSRTALQLRVPAAMRGRLLSIAMMDRGFIPLGTMLVGALASTSGPLVAGLAMGLSCLGLVGLIGAASFVRARGQALLSASESASPPLS